MGLAFLPSALPSAHRVPGSVPGSASTEGKVIASVYISPASCLPSIPSFLTHQCPLSFVVRRWGGVKSQAREAMDAPEWYPGSGKAAPSSLPLTPQGRHVQLFRLRIVQGATSKGDAVYTVDIFII